MADPIRMSALGRDAQVGDLYNFFTDVISPSSIDVPEKNKTISEAVGKPTILFFYQQPEKFKNHILGINSHLLQSINQGFVRGNQLWFADYLNTKSMDGDKQHAQVTLSFRVVRRIEMLNPDFLPSMMNEYQQRSGDVGATYVIEEIVYGAEVICSIRKALDLPRETKEGFEANIYLAIKKDFEETIIKSHNVEPPVEFDHISFTVLSSVEPGKKEELSFRLFKAYLLQLLSLDAGNIQRKWKPIEFRLRNIPAVRIEARLWEDGTADVALEEKRHDVTKKWITKKIEGIANNPCLKRFSALEKLVCHFRDLLPLFWKKIEEAHETNKTLTPDKVLEKMLPISDWLNKIIDWFAYRRREIEIIGGLLGDTDSTLLNLEEIERQMMANNCKTVKLFVLKIEQIEDFLVNDIQKFVGQEKSYATLPVLPVFFYEKEQLESVSAALSEFAGEAKKATQGSPYRISYHIVLDRFTSENAAIKTMDYSGTLSKLVSWDKPDDYLKKNQKQQPSFDSSFVSTPSSLLTPTVSDQIPICGTSQGVFFDASSAEKKPDESQNDNNMEVDDYISELDASDADGRQDMTGSTKTKSPITITNVKEQSTSMATQTQKNFNDDRRGEQNCTVLKPSSISEPGRASKEDDEDQNSRRTGHVNSQTSENRRVAEIYADSKYSTLIKKGSPNVFLLNATEKSNSDNIKWFEVCRPGGPSMSADPKQHKIIILMGGTGSGKSTLINGMVNYILGVQWNDPFRFKCVREDENVKNQAHSQTSSVTAYTLYHQYGMTIPYSITIIDTPGYGDTRGMKRDKEITANIHRFLTQQETRIDELHAVCFVAASGDSRLTATQRYIIDSVLAIFGKDMKENLRLLVTFADNAVPPVVSACRDSNFPVTSILDGVSYSKFNSSVLYCSNVRQSEEEFSFDELFWDMGDENFQKFFAVLKGMEGCDLKSTREVVRSRDHLEQSLIDIEQEMEVCLINIENMEMLQRKMKTCGHNIEANKNFMVEQTFFLPTKLNCRKGFFAYNCHRCQSTCVRGITQKSPFQNQKKSCTSKECSSCMPYDHSEDSWEWCMVPETMSVPLLDTMKAKFEKSLERRMNFKDVLDTCTEELQLAQVKVLSLFHQVSENVKSLEAAALKSNVLSTSDYLSFMRSRVLEEQKPGYLTRLRTLDELQQMMAVQMMAGGTSQQKLNTAARENREPTFTSYSDGASWSSAVKSYHDQPSSRNQTKLTKPPSDDQTQTKTGYFKNVLPKFLGGK